MKRLITLTGPSCAGKSTLERMLAARGAKSVVSTTTRVPRAGEVDGKDYHFVSYGKFELMVADDLFIESNNFGGNLYGVTVAELDRAFAHGNDVVLVCEPNGAKQIRKWAAGRNDIELRQVFIHAAPAVTASRFLTRFAADLEQARSLGTRLAVERTIEAYSKRMVNMQGIERDWSTEAYNTAHPARDALRIPHNGDFKYDVLLARFDDRNGNSVADSLMVPSAAVA